MKPQVSVIWKLQKAIYRQTKKKALSLEGECSPELLSYRQSQKRFAKRPFQKSNLSKLLSSIEQSQVTYLGDFHSFDQHSKNLSRILKVLTESKHTFSIGVEFIKEEYQVIIDTFLAGQLTEVEFLEQVEYYQTWRFPWSHYKVFFDLAKEKKLDIIALNSEGSLQQRDKKAARIITGELKRLKKQNQQRKMFVLIGELHIMPSKLPREVSGLIGSHLKNFKQCIIHQNLDDVYWRLHVHDIENDNHIVSFNDHEYSLQTSPPWIKYESMIYWYEYLSSDTIFELHDQSITSPMIDNVADIVIDLCRKVLSVLPLNITNHELEDINIYHHQHLEYILELIMSLEIKTEQKLFKKLLEENKVFKLPTMLSYYCPSYSINRISHIAGLHLFSMLEFKWDLPRPKLNIRSRFILNFKREFMAYFASKVINPFLKCDLYLDFKDVQMPPRHLSDVICIIENRKNIDLSQTLTKDHYHNLKSAQTLATYCAEMLYEEVMPKDTNGFRFVMDYIINKNLTQESFIELIEVLIPKKSYHSHRKRLF